MSSLTNTSSGIRAPPRPRLSTAQCWSDTSDRRDESAERPEGAPPPVSRIDRSLPTPWDRPLDDVDEQARGVSVAIVTSAGSSTCAAVDDHFSGYRWAKQSGWRPGVTFGGTYKGRSSACCGIGTRTRGELFGPPTAGGEAFVHLRLLGDDIICTARTRPVRVGLGAGSSNCGGNSAVDGCGCSGGLDCGERERGHATV